MSRVRSNETKLEIGVRKALSKKGYKYRKNVKYLLGKPDIAFIGKKTVVFIDSCFWHGCSQHCRMPSSNKEYWETKIKKNKERDREVSKRYKKDGWIILRFWEHQLKKDFDDIINKIIKKIE